MDSFETNWTKDGFLAYLLLYVAQSDFIESQEEKNLIISKVGADKFEKIHLEIDEDNDYQSLQKIMHYIDQSHFSREETNELLEEIKSLFLSDGDYNVLERNMLLGIKRLMR